MKKFREYIEIIAMIICIIYMVSLTFIIWYSLWL
jgi:hypothetical protein